MQLLIDTDALCKLGAADLLNEGLAILSATAADCGRLPAAEHMLRRGKLVRAYGQDVCARLLPLVAGMPVAQPPDTHWLDLLATRPEIDPGEALLLGRAAEDSLILLTGDKRALRAVKDVADFVDALAGRIVVLEAILLGLCDHLGSDEVRRRVQAVAANDTALRICFSATNADPRAGLESYFRDLANEVYPLILWQPHRGGAT